MYIQITKDTDTHTHTHTYTHTHTHIYKYMYICIAVIWISKLTMFLKQQADSRLDDWTYNNWQQIGLRDVLRLIVFQLLHLYSDESLTNDVTSICQLTSVQ